MPSFLSSNFLTPEEQSPVLVRTPSLPNELLILVLSHLNEKRDLAALSLTCQTFRSILEPQLYSRIDILFPNTTTPQTSMEQEPSLNGPRRAALCRTLVSPHYSSLVTSFNFVSPICNQDIRREFQEWWTRLPDKCDEIDAQLSNVLQALPNLHTLLVEFRACWTSNPEKRHRYLQNLKTRTLTSLSFKCYCSAEPLSQTYETLSSPCCQAIHSLKWERASKHARGGQQEFDVSRILPPLQKLGYVENKILDKLLSCRAITHLACEIWDDTRHRAFCKGPSNGTLTWLCTRVKTREVYEGDLSHLPNLSVSGRYLAIGVGDNPEAFKNVTHLGDLFFFFADPSEIIEHMKLFSSLPKLASIDVLNHMYGRRHSKYIQGYQEDPWKADLLNDLGVQHPSLRFVYITATNKDPNAFDPSMVFIVWQRSGNGEWTSRQAKDYDTIRNTWNKLD